MSTIEHDSKVSPGYGFSGNGSWGGQVELQCSLTRGFIAPARDSQVPEHNCTGGCRGYAVASAKGSGILAYHQPIECTIAYIDPSPPRDIRKGTVSGV